jgi:hypothetical protein
VKGATPEGELVTRVPSARLEVEYLLDNAPQVQPAILDTLSIEPDAHRMVLTWRAAFRCDKKALRVNAIRPFVRAGL